LLLIFCFFIREGFESSSLANFHPSCVGAVVFNGFNLIILSMLGEYIIRLVNQNSSGQSYYIRQIVKADE